MERTDIMQRLAVRALAMIEENIAAGVSYDGRQYQYSTKPFARPVRSLRDLKKFIGEGRVKPFTTAKGKLWALIPGGYRDWRTMNGLNPDGDFLQVRGAMLRNLGVLSVTGDTATLGFDDPEQREKAFWLQVTGVGPARTLWRFLGLTEAQQNELAEMAAGMMTAQDIASMLFK